MSLTTADLVRLQRATFEEFRSRPPRAKADDRERMFAVGKLAFCPVLQLLHRAGVEPTKPPADPADEAKKQAKFAAGNAIEKDIVRVYELAGLLIAKQIPFFDPELGLRGYGDAIWGGFQNSEVPYWWQPDYKWKVQEFQANVEEALLGTDAARGFPFPVTLSEIKWTATYSVKKMREAGEPAVWYRPQLAAYALMARRHPENIDAPEIERFEFAIFSEGEAPLIFELDEADVDAVEDRIWMLGEAWQTGQVPQCECGHVDGMGWAGPGNCDYTDPDDSSTCCGRTLLDRMAESVAVTA